jgi:hypothetical protein
LSAGLKLEGATRVPVAAKATCLGLGYLTAITAQYSAFDGNYCAVVIGGSGHISQMPDSTAVIVDGRTIRAFNTDSDKLAFEVDMKQRITSQSVEELYSGSVATMTFSPNDVTPGSGRRKVWFLSAFFHPEDDILITEKVKREDAFQDSLVLGQQEFLALLANLKRDIPFYSPRYIGHMLGDQLLPAIAE